MKKVCLGGTFDHLHAGHKRLIDAAIAHCYDQNSTCVIRSLTIGVSEDELLKGKAYAEFIQDYDTRVRAIRQYDLALI
ncbi:hypothetical protein [Legionella sp. W05-934-2]|uniref:hypothetical protein n=1 Tax=Legionella sp. W05-934-2 TaxID=1198649 RepID=UPI00346206F8